ncbi:cationic amino acid transporter 3-like [Chelonus insularis]|uniref:cationic amino acid transporter 3-like n=1 Tax=Chelonus insularis TaxID=460826 RepID=UPI00158AF520|nr:cationic amino acid transporter 3-like [Chelonus insularis]XP_034938010.1 cationic amino acid transporter 3-like [Chelonus insularis]XP_034938012.1 cationic amino acid transporter 3-like [Chelonus insularis]XP_034938013.1 cationic amino acid transporter 3-like [Chelonus insularis]
MATKLWKALIRRRIEEDNEGKGELARVLGLFDLSALGVGATLGLGVYVLAGSVARETAGPAVCISFLIAAFASALAGMCYAEFASRVPKAGSAYVYSYVTVGEFIAFVIGWNLILEYVIGTASVARGLSNYVDSLIENKMRDYFQSVMPINVPFLSDYPDFFAFLVVMLLVLLLCIGVQESSYLNMCFTAVNLVTILIVIVAGSIKADPANWRIPKESIPPEVKHAGVGGFMPFGISGVMFGAAKCFYGFVGFDAVAATGEEAKNPQKNIPLAIVISLSIIFAAYFSISTVLTMMWPYYDQNPEAPFPYVFQQIGWPVIMWIVNVGAVFALCTSLLGAMFPLPRILYAMASDGVIFKFLAKINNRTQTPILGTIISGLLIGLMTLMFNLEQLIDMMSIGTLLAYTIVAISVLILRYQKTSPNVKIFSHMPMENHSSYVDYFKRVFNICNEKVATNFSSRVASWGVLVFAILVFIFGLTIKYVQFDNNPGDIFAYFVLMLIGLMIISTMFAIGRQPVDSITLAFKVPLVPLVPCGSIFINLFLMLQLDIFTWIRFVVWMVIGFCIYFFYGIRNSSQGQRDRLLNNRTTIHDYTNPVRLVTKF